MIRKVYQKVWKHWNVKASTANSSQFHNKADFNKVKIEHKASLKYNWRKFLNSKLMGLN